MAPIQPAQHPQTEEPGGEHGRGRKAMRYAVPVVVAGVAAATISLVPALADTGDPSLPTVTAEQLLTKIAASDTQTVDGTVRISTDLGLPSALSGAGGNLFAGAGTPGRAGGDGAGGGSPAAPQSQLPQLLAGTHRLHVAADGPERQKVSLIEPAAEYSVIHNGTQLWAYDSASDQAYHRTLPRPAGGDHDGARRAPGGSGNFAVTPQDAARRILDAADGTASVTVDGTARVAGHSAYQLLVRPQHADATTVGAIRIAVDARTGVPLKFTLTPKGGGKAVFDVAYTRVSFDKPAASTFRFTPPKGVKVTEGGTADAGHRHGMDRQGMNGHGMNRQGMDGQTGHTGGSGRSGQPTVLGEGWDAIAVIQSAGRMPSGQDGNGRPGADSMLNSFGKRVSGSYGDGTLFHTRLVNVLLTDKGTLYAGAVTESALTAAANAAAK